MSATDGQRTPEWFLARANKATASAAAAWFGANAFVNHDQAARRLRGEDAFSGNLATFWGQMMEAVACAEYAKACDVTVEETGFWPWKRDGDDVVRAGGSPDGLVSDVGRSSPSSSSALKGVIEIKCQNSSAGPKMIRSAPYHIYQCQMNAMVTGRHFCDYISWTPLRMTVERIPRADYVPVGPLDLCAHDVADWTAKGVYDPTTRTWPGSVDVFYGVVKSFQQQATDGRGFPDWEAWKLYNSKPIELINALFKGVLNKEKRYVRLLCKVEKELPVPKKLLPKKMSWMCAVLWQMEAISQKKHRPEATRMHRFALHTLGTPNVRHMMDTGTFARPPWFTYTGVCVDILHGADLRKCKRLTYPLTDGEHEINYFPFERNKLLPMEGTVVTTVFRDGNVVSYGVRPWNLHRNRGLPRQRVEANGARAPDVVAYRDVALTEHTMARVDYSHRHVTFLVRPTAQ